MSLGHQRLIFHQDQHKVSQLTAYYFFAAHEHGSLYMTCMNKRWEGLKHAWEELAAQQAAQQA